LQVQKEHKGKNVGIVVACGIEDIEATGVDALIWMRVIYLLLAAAWY